MSFDDTFEKPLVDAYDKSARHFSQLFNATILFAFAFLAFILVPLVALQRENATIDQDLMRAKVAVSTAATEQRDLASLQEQTRAQLGNLPAKRDELKGERAALEDRDAQLQQEIDSVEQTLAKFTREQARIESMLDAFRRATEASQGLPPLDVAAFVRELQDFLRQQSDVIWRGAPLEVADFRPVCPMPEPDVRANCVIRAKVMQMLGAAEQRLREQIVVPLMAADRDVANAVEARLKEAHEKFGQRLDEQPSFWQEVVQKQNVGQDFAAEIDRISRDVEVEIFNKVKQTMLRVSDLQMQHSIALDAAQQKTIEIAGLRQVKAESERKIATLEAEISGAEARIAAVEQKIADVKAKVAATTEQVAALTDKQAKIGDRQKAISERMKGVQSPFGTLPIELTEAVRVFPIIVAVGFVMALLALANAMRLRGRYHLLLRRKFPAESAEVDERVALTAPLFLDPLRRLGDNLWRGAVLLLPALVYVAGIVLIAESQRLAPQAEETSRFIDSGYGWLYLAMALFLVLPLYQIVTAWKSCDLVRRAKTTLPPREPSESLAPAGS
jgi:hypothetical protein